MRNVELSVLLAIHSTTIQRGKCVLCRAAEKTCGVIVCISLVSLGTVCARVA